LLGISFTSADYRAMLHSITAAICLTISLWRLGIVVT